MLCISKQAYRISLAVQFPCLSRWQWIYRSMRKYLEIASQWCHMQSRESRIDSSTVLCTMTVRHSLWKCCCCVSINWWQVVLGESGHVTSFIHFKVYQTKCSRLGSLVTYFNAIGLFCVVCICNSPDIYIGQRAHFTGLPFLSSSCEKNTPLIEFKMCVNLSHGQTHQ